MKKKNENDKKTGLAKTGVLLATNDVHLTNCEKEKVNKPSSLLTVTTNLPRLYFGNI